MKCKHCGEEIENCLIANQLAHLEVCKKFWGSGPPDRGIKVMNGQGVNIDTIGDSNVVEIPPHVSETWVSPSPDSWISKEEYDFLHNPIIFLPDPSRISPPQEFKD